MAQLPAGGVGAVEQCLAALGGLLGRNGQGRGGQQQNDSHGSLSGRCLSENLRGRAVIASALATTGAIVGSAHKRASGDGMQRRKRCPGAADCLTSSL